MPIRPYRPDSAITDDRPMPMTSRERVLTALAHEEPDRVPIVIGVGAPDAYLYDWPELGTAAIDEATLGRLHGDARGIEGHGAHGRPPQPRVAGWRGGERRREERHDPGDGRRRRAGEREMER